MLRTMNEESTMQCIPVLPYYGLQLLVQLTGPKLSFNVFSVHSSLGVSHASGSHSSEESHIFISAAYDQNTLHTLHRGCATIYI